MPVRRARDGRPKIGAQNRRSNSEESKLGCLLCFSRTTYFVAYRSVAHEPNALRSGVIARRTIGWCTCKNKREKEKK